MKKCPNTYRWLALVGCASTLLGQSDEPVELEGFISDEVPVEESILPTTRPFNSVYGTDRSILETPRNVTIISREQLDAISIKTPRDFARLTSSSYTKSNFGAPTSPNLRGQEADLFVNGIRKGLTSNGNGLPINFNAVESVNIVKGPAGSVYGTSNYLGGYADLITKRAFFDQARGSLSMTAGSYDVYYGQLDYSTPINDELAVRFSYSGEASKGYYELGKKNTQAFYATLTYRPSDNYELFVAGEFFVADYTENWGINRPTQDLIDHGLYYPNAQTDQEYLDYIDLLGSSSVFGGVRGETAASLFGGAGFHVFAPLDLDNPVKLGRDQRLLSPGDDSYGRNFWAQAIQTFTVSDAVTVVNNSYYQWIDRSTFSSYHYSELLRDNWSFDNRTEVRIKGETDSIKYNVNTGLRVRFQDVWSANHFNNEPVNFWDLTRDNDTFRVPNAGFEVPYYAIVADEAPHGKLDYWYVGGEAVDYDDDGIDDYASLTAGDSSTSYVGPYAQFDLEFADRFTFLAGVGVDYVDTETKLPSEIEAIPGTGSLPLYSADYDPIANPSGKADASLINYSFSGVAKITEKITTYVTYGYSESHAAETGGRVIPNFDSPQESKLLEAGLKFSLLDDKLFIGAAVFDREFVTRNQDGSTDDVFVDGFEIEMNYQPNKNFYLTAGYSYLDARRELGFFATPYTADRADETGGIFTSATFININEDGTLFDYPGSPTHQFTSLASYKFDNGFGVRANLVVTSEMNTGYDGSLFLILGGDQPDTVMVGNTVKIPWQYEVDLTLFYEYKDWEFKATVFNVTDEENWDAPNAGYGNGSVVAREPIRVEGTITYNF